MNGSLALLIALVSYGNNQIVNGHSLPILDFKNSTLIYNDRIIFHDNLTIAALNPEEWFNYLKKDGCKKLRIYYTHSDQSQLKDYQTSGLVGGGGDWVIEAVYTNYSNFWVSSMRVVNRNASDNRIWETEFHVIKNKPSIAQQDISIEKAKAELSAQLIQIEKFAAENGLSGYAETFCKVNDMLSDFNPTVEYYADFIVTDYLSLPARQLLFSACSAYVFGGMGSWSDYYFSDNATDRIYNELTEKLYERVNQSIIVAINAKK